jgi:hypothetical protein
VDNGAVYLYCRRAASFNKLLNKDKKQLVFAPSSLILTNYFLPVNRALYFKGDSVDLIKKTFVEMQSRYINILNNYYPAHKSIGFTERNLTNNFVSSMEKVNENNCISWFEAPITDDESLHVDAIIFDLSSQTLFVIEAKRLKSSSDLVSVRKDIKRMHNKTYIEQLERELINIKIKKRFAIVLADVWVENTPTTNIYNDWPKCISEESFDYSNELGFESLSRINEWKNKYHILIAVDEIKI